MLFRNRVDAGKRLSVKLEHLRDRRPIVVALPRGGVPVAYEIALALEAPLDVLVARKLGAPGHPELGVGAIADGGATYLDAKIIETLGVTREQLDRIAESEQSELSRRVWAYRGNKPPLDVRGKTVILVDDGLATGVTARAAIGALRRQGPAKLVFAAPVCASQTVSALAAEVDEVVCAARPTELYAVGIWYDDFSQTTDDQVVTLLHRAWQEERERNAPGPLEELSGARLRPSPATPSRSEPPAEPGLRERTISFEVDDVVLEGTLSVPERAFGVVLFAHGSGSSRHSPRNRYVATEMHRAGLATLLVDLLSADEEAVDERTRHLRFDIALLARRLSRATDWLSDELPDLPIGYFGASTGAAAAIVSAARHPDRVLAVVSRGGRPDLAGSALPSVRAPTLLIVGGDDPVVLDLNRQAMTHMRSVVQMEVVPKATHLFEEPGALTRVAQLSSAWLVQYLSTALRTPRKESA